MPHPNIIYMHSHDTGRYVQPYGYNVPTPNMQRLAEQGVLFRQAFCAAPTCSPSRAALLTGRSPHSCGMLGLAHRGWKLADKDQHIVHVLRKAGYVSALAGAQHVVAKGENVGYDHMLNSERKVEPHVAARQFLDNAPQQPFFLDVGFSLTHRTGPTFNGPMSPTGDPRYVRPPAPLPDNAQTRQDFADFAVCANRLDQAYGVVLDALEQNGLAENTLVICTTDHGIAFPDMKCSLTDHGMGVLLIMRGPRGFTGGKVIDGMVSHIDVLPTICELIGIDAPAGAEGRSFTPLVQGSAAEVNEAVFSEVTYHAAYEPKRAVRTARWKYIRRFDDRQLPTLANCDDSVSKSLWLDADWRNRPVEHESLYDLLFDPNEANNLAGSADHGDVVTDMRQRLHQWMCDTNDPLLKGDVPLAAGGITNDRDSLSPRDRPVSA